MKRIGWLIIPLAASLVLITGCGREDTETEAQIRYETATVARGDITAEVVTDGTVVAPPNRYAAIECSYCAPVSRVFATVGQSLSAGDVIVELSHPDVRAALDAAQTELSQARSALESARGNYMADVDAARAELQAAQAQERQARSALQEAEEQAPPPDDLVALQVDYERAHERRLRAEQRLADAQARAEEALEPSRRRVAAAEQDVASARADQQIAMIKTPIDGHLIELNVGPGDQPGQIGGPMAVVANLSTLRVHARMADEQAAQVDPGMAATITLPMVPDVIFRGQVERLNTVLEGATTQSQARRGFVAVIPFRNERGLAKPEMGGQVIIDLGTATDVLVVPAAAVERDDAGQPFVNVQAGERWERRDVVVGLSDGEMTQIRAGLDEGEVVRVQMQVVPAGE